MGLLVSFLPLFFFLLFVPLNKSSEKHLDSEDLNRLFFRTCSNSTIFPSSIHDLTEEDRKFCQWADSESGGGVKRGGSVLVGGSWGRLRSSEMRKRYVDLLCPLMTSKHPQTSCDALWGDDLIDYWRGTGKRAKCISPNGHEVMKCHRSPGELSTQCSLRDAIVDFSLVTTTNGKVYGTRTNKRVFPHGI